MRISTPERSLSVVPGNSTSVTVDVVNTGDVIDGVSAAVIGLPPEWVTAQPAVLPLFPSASGQVTLALAIPPAYPAGRHPITVELVSHGTQGAPQYLDVDVEVDARPSMTLNATPRLVRARRAGKFAISVANDGNVPLDVTLAAVDIDRASSATFVPGHLRVEPGTTAPVMLTVRGPRMLTGAENDRVVEVVAAATRADVVGAAPAIERTVELTGARHSARPGPAVLDLPANPVLEPRTVGVTLKQRPLIARGLLTALILMVVVAMWAGAFLFGLTSVFSGDPMTKAAPASFFAATKVNGLVGGPGGVPAPAGALPKSGQVPAGVGGAISGVVQAASTQSPAGRVLVEAMRMTRKGLTQVSSAATQADGSYTLAGLFPTDYYLQFSSPSFTTVWYPGVPGRARSTAVSVGAQQTSTLNTIVVKGLPASISGTVDPGDTTNPAPTTVTARPLNLAGTVKKPTPVVTNGAHKYRITGLVAPASYQLTFVTDGYQTTSIVDAVDGGDTRIEPTVTLGAGQGSITGTVVSGTGSTATPVGGATVTTDVGGKTVTVTTPTAGAVGTFAIPNLPTPATYVLRYSAPGYGSFTEVIRLGAGESDAKARGELSGGSGTIGGIVYDGDSSSVPRNRTGLGGVSVVAGGLVLPGSTGGTGGTTGTTGSAAGGTGTAAPTTTTLTIGTVGQFAFTGLPAGSYTLTFTRDGYAPASVLVSLSADDKLPPLRVTLFKDRGEITGTVYGHNGGLTPPLAGATVTATDGVNTYTALTSDAGGSLDEGGYDIAGLPAGVYTVTVTGPGIAQKTRIVRLSRSETASDIDFHTEGI